VCTKSDDRGFSHEVDAGQIDVSGALRARPQPDDTRLNTTRPSSHGCRLHSIRVCCGLPTAAAPGHDDENGRPLSVDFRPTSSSLWRKMPLDGGRVVGAADTAGRSQMTRVILA